MTQTHNQARYDTGYREVAGFKAVSHVRYIHVQRHIYLHRGETGNFDIQRIHQDTAISEYKSVSKNLAYGARVVPSDWAETDAEYISKFRSELDDDTRWMVTLNSQLAEWIKKYEKEQNRHEELLAENARLKRAARPTENPSSLSDVFTMTNEQIYKDLRAEREKNSRLKVKELEQRDRHDSLKYRYGILKDSSERMDKEIVRLQKEVANANVKIRLHECQLKGLDEQDTREKELVKSTKLELRDCRNSLNTATIAHIRSENAKYTVMEHISFIEMVHQLEMGNLRQVRQSSDVICTDWNTEMMSAMQEIRALYDGRMVTVRQELTQQYELRIEKFTYVRIDNQLKIIREQVKRQRDEISDIRAELNGDQPMRIDELRIEIQMRKYNYFEMKEKYRKELMQMMKERKEWDIELAGIISDLEHITVSKHNLEVEIKVYETLLEKLNQGKQKIQFKVLAKQVSILKRCLLEVTQKTRRLGLGIAQRNIITLCIKNPTDKTWDVSGFKVFRLINGKETESFIYPKKTFMPPGGEVTIWAKGDCPDLENKAEYNLEADFTSWANPKFGETVEFMVLDRNNKIVE